MTEQIARKIKLGESISDKTHQALRDLGWADPNDLQDLRGELNTVKQKRDELQKRFDHFVQDCGTTMYPCPECGHGMSSRKGCFFLSD